MSDPCELPEWAMHLVRELQAQAQRARGHARGLDPKKHLATKGIYNTEASICEAVAQRIQKAWKEEQTINSTLYERLRVDIETLLVLHTIPTGIRMNDGAVVSTTETPIQHQEICRLLAKYPRRYPPLDDEEETVG